MSRCCGPTVCDGSREEYICQARNLLPDFQGRLKVGGFFLGIFDALIGCFYDLIVARACDLEKEFNACTSEDYRDEWTDEYGLPFRCPLGDEISEELEAELLTLQLCLQVQLTAGAVFNQALLDQIADVLDITYTVKVPTYKPEGLPICDVIPMPPTGFSRCNPNGCVFQQAYYICIQCAPSDAHVDVFKCFIDELNSCHVSYCILDETPKLAISQSCCTEEVEADCTGLGVEILQSCCTETVEAD